jgi:hypothetical protein
MAAGYLTAFGTALRYRCSPLQHSAQPKGTAARLHSIEHILKDPLLTFAALKRT